MKKYIKLLIIICSIIVISYVGYSKINKAAVVNTDSEILENRDSLFNYDIDKANKIIITNGAGLEGILEDKTQIDHIIKNLNERRFIKGDSSRDIVGCGGYLVRIYYKDQGNIDSLVIDSDNQIKYNNYFYNDNTSSIDVDYIDNIFINLNKNLFKVEKSDISKIQLEDGYTNKNILVENEEELNSLIKCVNNIKGIKQNNYPQSDRNLTFKIDIYNKNNEIINSFKIGRNSIIYIGDDRYIDKNKTINYNSLFDLLEIESTIVE